MTDRNRTKSERKDYHTGIRNIITFTDHGYAVTEGKSTPFPVCFFLYAVFE